MSTYVVLLRGVNVSGKNRLLMADFRSAVEAAGFDAVRTYMQSGNLLVDRQGTSAPKVRTEIHALIARDFGLDVPVLVRTPKQWLSLSPLATYDVDCLGDAGLKQLYVSFLDRSARASDAAKLDTIRLGEDSYTLSGTEILLNLPSGAGNTKLTNAAIEKKLGVVATTRNWRTIGKIASML